MIEVQTITRAEWRAKHSDFKGGTMKVEPRILQWVDNVGTCLIPVVVVNDDGTPYTQRIWNLSETDNSVILEGMRTTTRGEQ